MALHPRPDADQDRDVPPSGSPQVPAPGLGAADVLLSDGSVAVIRTLGEDDYDALHDLHERVSDESLRMRFFSSNRRAGHDYVEHLRRDATPCLVVECGGRLVALATAEPLGPDSSEVAFLVDDDLRGHGIGSLLLEHLAALGRDRGVARFEAEVLAENHAMLGVFLDAGFAVSRRTDLGVVDVRLDTRVSTVSQAAADAREFRAEARSLRPLLHPGSVAVVGVRRDGTGVGAAVLRSVAAGGFAGSLYVVNPGASAGDGAVAGVTAYPSFADLPESVDLVLVAVPAAEAVDALAGAAAAGARAAVVLSTGFDRLPEGGAAAERALLGVARTHSMRLVGPDSLGVMSVGPDVQLHATFGGLMPLPGRLAIASQSGGVGIALADHARELGLGVGSFVSLGTKVDVSSNDLLGAWLDDPGVGAAALYLESFGNAPKFARFARRFAERKPLLAVVGGRSAGTRHRGESHTAAAATADVGVEALFAQAGVIRCDEAEDLAQTALLLTEQPLPRGARVAVLSNAGGLGLLAADEAHDRGLVLPVLSEGVQAALAAALPEAAASANPVDAGAAADPAGIAEACRAVLASGEVDALVVVLARTDLTDAEGTLAALVAVRADHPDLPVVLVPMGGLRPDRSDTTGLTVLRSPRAATRALARAATYAAWRDVPREEPEGTDVDRVAAVRRTASALLSAPAPAVAGVAGAGWLDPGEARSLLEGYGLAPVGRVATDPASAVAAAREAGFPVAVKVSATDVLHKTDRGLVRVGLRDEAEVLAAVRAFEVELGRADVPVLVQPVARGVEVALGVVRDLTFGPLVMMAAGGVASEVWDDRVFVLPPVTPGDAERALRSLRVWPLLAGFRGAEPVDVAALVRAVVSLGRLALDVPQLAEADLNPVLVSADGCTLVDVKVRLAEPVGAGLGLPRQLRGPVLG